MGALVSVARGKKSVEENAFYSSTPAYSHIILDNTNYKIGVKTADKYEFKLALNKDEAKFDVPFEIKGDTLILSKIPDDIEKKIKYVQLNLPEKNLEVQMLSSNLNIDSYSGNTLKLDLDESDLNILPEAIKKISKVEVNSRNKSTLRCYSNVAELQLNINDSEFKALGSVDNVSGEIADKSYVYITNPGNTNLQKDADSKINYSYR
ncbi:hypothetical protein EI427_18555 [Flammeovirga pectinis]|uniref:Uncharacterized protein n=1 Tax=Flammeovirga pectinis TaxID=2494373 RepID=A0A3Q9FNE5_9BACT|nr:hypothetical protein [Flammeovirga pectinis]AZQ64153.1 hypothetical protein EI427_18555 [Flammeovirga pectinis]